LLPVDNVDYNDVFPKFFNYTNFDVRDQEVKIVNSSRWPLPEQPTYMKVYRAKTDITYYSSGNKHTYAPYLLIITDVSTSANNWMIKKDSYYSWFKFTWYNAYLQVPNLDTIDSYMLIQVIPDVVS